MLATGIVNRGEVPAKKRRRNRTSYKKSDIPEHKKEKGNATENGEGAEDDEDEEEEDEEDEDEEGGEEGASRVEWICHFRLSVSPPPPPPELNGHPFAEANFLSYKSAFFLKFLRVFF